MIVGLGRLGALGRCTVAGLALSLMILVSLFFFYRFFNSLQFGFVDEILCYFGLIVMDTVKSISNFGPKSSKYSFQHFTVKKKKTIQSSRSKSYGGAN